MADHPRPATSVYNPPAPRPAGKPVMKGRCVYCKSKMKMVWFEHATHCRKCGRIQPWAKAEQGA